MFIVAREYNGACLLMHFKNHRDFHLHLAQTKFQVDEFECLEVEGMNLDVRYKLSSDSESDVKCALCTTQDCNSFLFVYQKDQDLTQVLIENDLYDFKLFNQVYNKNLFLTEEIISIALEGN